VSNHDVRTGLLKAHRAALRRLLHNVARRRATGAFTAYALTLTQPTGYLIAAGLQRRYGTPDPDRWIRAAVSTGGRARVVLGVVERSALVEILATLAPATQRLAIELRRAAAPPPRVLVTGGGGAEFFTL
jgi:hypothetical protein